jgi:hypothetical protein
MSRKQQQSGRLEVFVLLEDLVTRQKKSLLGPTKDALPAAQAGRLGDWSASQLGRGGLQTPSFCRNPQRNEQFVGTPQMRGALARPLRRLQPAGSTKSAS